MAPLPHDVENVQNLPCSFPVAPSWYQLLLQHGYLNQALIALFNQQFRKLQIVPPLDVLWYLFFVIRFCFSWHV